jgi:PAS domain S-box-containing protein
MNKTPEQRNHRVLIIDDNRAIHDDFRKILAGGELSRSVVEESEAVLFGASVEAVASPQFDLDSAYQGQEGVAAVKKALEEGRPYAMAFVDVRMPPGWDGIETTKRIWEIDPSIQIVICTAYSDYSWGDMFRTIGAGDGLLILKKPFDAVEALQLAQALTEKWWLHQQSVRKMEELEGRVIERTRELQQSNSALQTEVVNHMRAEDELRLKTAFLEAQVNSSIDGILVVDQDRRTSLQNQRFTDLFKMPRHIADDVADDKRLQWVTDMIKYPEPFMQKVLYLYAHPHEISRDEVELRDGTILDRYSSPAVGKHGKYYGRIWMFRDVTERKREAERLRESEEKFRQLTENINDVFWMTSPDMQQVLYVSPGYERMWGRSAAKASENPHEWSDAIVPEQRGSVFATFGRLIAGEASASAEFQIARPNGELRWIHSRGFQIRDPAGKVIRLAGIASDITERKRLEASWIQSQKLETVGKLAGGIAHEFNSIMTAIIGQSELLLGDLPAGCPMARSATEINQAAGRAATLTRQLLAFGRKQFLRPEVLDLNRVIVGMESVFRLLMGADVDTRIIPAPGLQSVKADAGQVEQVIMNIVINARDAMPQGGKLTIETANVSLDEESVDRYSELKAGDYVMLAVTDTGGGMPEEVKARLFEPFFTTKEVGRGPGLGLSTCYGIIKQSGGHISVYSEVGHGTTFKIYLPQVEQQVKPYVERLASPTLSRGTETILLVEDDTALREMAGTLLRRLGYTVWVAANGVEALSLKKQASVGRIDLLFTDIVMPHMSGKELADRVAALHPHTKTLFTTAYTENATIHQGVLDKGVALLQKPYTPSALARKVREVLEQRNQS